MKFSSVPLNAVHIAVVLAAGVFLLDLFAQPDVTMSILYVLVLVIAAGGASERRMFQMVAGCVALTILSWLISHGAALLWSSVLRLLFSLITIALTGALILSKKKLQRVRYELEESKFELENFTNSVPHILWRSTRDAYVDFYNKRYTEIIGRDSRETIANQDWILDFHPDDRDWFLERVKGAFAEKDDLKAVYRLKHADGNYRWVSLVARPVRAPETGEIIRYYGGTSDVHEVVLAQLQIKELNETLEQRVAERTAELLKTESRFESIFDLSNLTFAEQDLGEALVLLRNLHEQGVTDFRTYMSSHPVLLDRCVRSIRTVRVNRALARLLGYDTVEALAAMPPEQNAEEGRLVLIHQLEMAFYKWAHIEGRTTLVGREGRRIPILYMVSNLSDGRQLSSHIDLTHQEHIEEMRLAAQEELARANRVATVGAFSASIAHELNQPISSIVMDAQTGLRWLRRDAPDVAAAVRILERLARTADRIAGIVQRTRDSIASGRRTVQIVDVSHIAMEARNLLRREARNANATVELRLAEAPCLVRADPIELQQVLVNLLTNAMDAMREQEGERLVTVAVFASESEVTVSVEDRGPGFPDGEIEKLFKPFFTTKPNGVGMGLQICRTIVESFGGTLHAQNGPLGGALFEFSLPSASVAAVSSEV
ncbi:hypothetical protein GCM10007301_52490 [Azorhizobium oxalatiphilum]|uniref:histidine kinase n=1 Tax=Azorhizobium oxalatiphilum TaxID=980631 RepID=A0A917FIR7_9HYPH|nr:ATP-binding protein [Azorhizobium oxalatiphilum]GGF86116.1 hypothetical protein GCM10007301_52490 [Azorhizobium oxalatiphilum]